MSVSNPSIEQPADDGRARERREVVVVGASQAGLAIGYFLAKHGRDFTILDAAAELAADMAGALGVAAPVHLRPLRRAAGPAFPGDPDRYPSKDEVADYLAEYARRFELPVELGSRVRLVSASNGDLPRRA